MPAALRGRVLLNELGGTPLANVQLTAPGATPHASSNAGWFELTFLTKGPGEQVSLSAQREGYQVVHYIMLEQVLPIDPDSRPVDILMCNEGNREEMARRFFRFQSIAAIEQTFQLRIREIQEQHESD